MTLQDIQNAIEQFEQNFTQITLTENRIIKGVLQDAFPGHPQDPRGYIEPYFYVIRIDIPNNPTEMYNCEEVLEITSIN